MKTIIKLSGLPFILAAMLLIWMSCEQKSYYNNVDCDTYDYSDCNFEEPDSIRFNVNLSINEENPSVALAIYEGNADDGVLIHRDTVTHEKYSIFLLPDKYYSVTAVYKRDGSVIIAVDGDDVKKIRNQVCEEICWEVEEGNVNVELKNAK